MKQHEIYERNKKIIQLAQENYTADKIAELVGIKRYRVMQILRASKIKVVKESHKLKCESAQCIISELKAGKNQSDIARQLGVSRQYVNQVKKTFMLMNKSINDI